jgi:hypothetical protein
MVKIYIGSRDSGQQLGQFTTSHQFRILGLRASVLGGDLVQMHPVMQQCLRDIRETCNAGRA